jgi:hypothetical protein
MKKYAFWSVLALVVCLAPAAVHAQALSFFQGFETNTAGWSNFGNGSLLRVTSGYSNAGGYGDRINSAAGDFHARLLVDPLANFGQGDKGTCSPGHSDCVGPFTDWNLNSPASLFPNGGDRTSIDIYLDTDFAASHPDYRFDWDSALNDSTGQFLEDFVFNVGTGTGQADDKCATASTAHFVVSASTKSGRENVSPEDQADHPQCISKSGWYRFEHEFKADIKGHLEVAMSVVDLKSGATVARWVLHPTCAVPQSAGLCSEGDPLPISAAGGNAYGWFSNQEIDELPIDDSVLHTLWPQTKADCKNYGWKNFTRPTFDTLAECLNFVATRD